jgi:hypothetical protein
MQTGIAIAALITGLPGPLTTLFIGGVMLLAGLYFLVGLAVTAEINKTISVIHQRDTPAR